MSGKVSVIVPIYNAEAYLDRALESITKQSYEQLEILLINDGSTDSSETICKGWSEKDLRIRLISQENAGVSVARNLGLDQSSGDYILFVDADDWIDTNMVSEMVEAIEAENADVATCKLKEETDYKDQAGSIKPQRTIFEGKEEAGLALLNVWAIYCKLYKKEILESIRFESYRVAEDVLFNSCVIADTGFKKVVELDTPFYHYYIHDGSVMTAKTLDRKFLDAMYVEENCLQKLTAISNKFADINLIGCSVSRVFEKYSQLTPEQQRAQKNDFQEAKRFAKKHKQALVNVSNRHRKISGMLKVYLPDLYLRTLIKRYQA